MKEIALGHGNVGVSYGWKDGRKFLCLSPEVEAHPVGKMLKIPPGKRFGRRDTIIWLDNPKGGEVLAAMLKKAIKAQEPQRAGWRYIVTLSDKGTSWKEQP